MANTRSALKRVHQTETRTAQNRALKSRVKTTRKVALSAITAGDAAAAKLAYDKFSSAADKAAKKGALTKNTASRLKGRIGSKVSALTA